MLPRRLGNRCVKRILRIHQDKLRHGQNRQEKQFNTLSRAIGWIYYRLLITARVTMMNALASITSDDLT